VIQVPAYQIRISATFNLQASNPVIIWWYSVLPWWRSTCTYCTRL